MGGGEGWGVFVAFFGAVAIGGGTEFVFEISVVDLRGGGVEIVFEVASGAEVLIQIVGDLGGGGGVPVGSAFEGRVYSWCARVRVDARTLSNRSASDWGSGAWTE